jgi:hypothetical protein
MGPRGMARRRGRRRGLIVGAAVGSAMARRNSNDNEPQQYAPQDEGMDEVSELENLGRLKQQGIITEEEFAAKKKQILGI